jgi:hypothetical protein
MQVKSTHILKEQREGHVRTWKESEQGNGHSHTREHWGRDKLSQDIKESGQARGTYSLESIEKGTS